MIDSPKEYTIKGCLRSYKESGEYINLVVENIEETNPKYRYLWLTIPPNWSDVKLTIDEVMFFSFIVAEGGNQYYDANEKCIKIYNSSTNWYRKSIPLNCNSESRELIIA